MGAHTIPELLLVVERIGYLELHRSVANIRSKYVRDKRRVAMRDWMNGAWKQTRGSAR